MTITRFEILTNRVFTYLFATGCVALMWMMWMELDAAKFEVIQAVKFETGTLHGVQEAIKEQLVSMQTEMDRRGLWMQSIDAELAHRLRDRIYRSEFQEWLNDAKEFNPDFVVPELMSNPPEVESQP